MTTPVNIGMIGCGRVVVSTHLPLLTQMDGVVVVGLADTNPRGLEQAGALVPAAKRFTDYQRLLAESDAEAIVVSVPTGLHAACACAVLESGRHLYLEKPLASQRAEAERILAAWRAADRVGMIGFNYRFNVLQQAAQRAWAAGRVGDLVAVRTLFTDDARDLPAWLRDRHTGGGPLLELGSHHFDLVPWLLGSPAREVETARCTNDEARVTLRLEDGTAVESRFAFADRQRDCVELVGTRGRLMIDRFRSLRVEPHRAGPLTMVKQRLARYGRSRWLGDEVIPPPRESSYADALRQFVDAVRQRRLADPDLLDGWRSLAVVLAAEESAATGRKVTLAR